jgi:hypothetical protein
VMSVCPACGAVLPLGANCQELFDLCMAREFVDPDYFAVHHLSVPAYLLQHNAYSRHGWLATRRLLARLVDAAITPATARRQGRGAAGGERRTWSFTRGPKLAGVDNIRWTCTIADVRLDSAEQYCADVCRWAASVLADTAALAESAGSADQAGHRA